jgi:chromate transporter
MVLGFSYLYIHSHLVQGATSVFAGMQAGALAVILLSAYQLSASYRRKLSAWVIVPLSGILIYLFPGIEPLAILGCGLAGAFWYGSRARAGRALAAAPWVGARAVRALAAQGATGAPLAKIFWVCLKAGTLVFGTGLAVVPVLESDVVQRFQWLTHSQFMDALAVGQITPGPVTIAATFIGFVAAGLPGALTATAGMYLPAFFNVLVLVPRVWNRFSGTPGAQGFSAWAIPAVIGGILGTTVRLGYLTLTGPAVVAIFVAALGAAIWLRIPAWLLIPLSGAAGALSSVIG